MVEIIGSLVFFLVLMAFARHEQRDVNEMAAYRKKFAPWEKEDFE